MATLLYDLSRFTTETFVAGLWQGFVLIAAVAICLRFFSQVSASVRFTIWSITFALVLAVPLLHLRAPATQHVASPSAILHITPICGLAVAALWIIATFARFTFLLMQAARLHRIWKRATPIVPPTATAELLRTRRHAHLCVSADVDSPCVIGFVYPRLLLPESLLSDLAPSDLHQIALHECEHLRRGDDWINLLQKIALVLFPLNPALLIADRRLSVEREYACDAGVVASTAAPFDYAHCLTRLAEHKLHSRKLALALSAWSRQSELAGRVYTLLQPMRRLSPLHTRTYITAFSLVLAAGAVQLTRSPRLIAFTEPVTAPITATTDLPSSLPIPTATPVIFHPTHSELTLLKATLPSTNPTPTPTLLAQKTTRKHPARTTTRTHHSPLPPRQPGNVRTAYTQQDEQTVHAYYTVYTEFSSSYAAISVGNDWLIVQL